jgi:hypothetical protein
MSRGGSYQTPFPAQSWGRGRGTAAVPDKTKICGKNVVCSLVDCQQTFEHFLPKLKAVAFCMYYR